ncbi:3-deoxy-D-manno-octulosonic acid kinase [Pseudoalteromonas aurantia]|uniref:3-deoxy-D-manno-octulosonic acid kinase n=1 Tax=Pseudoalteromonas aurantia 208 TaxID=1314867 RepID=A0ABR9E7W7_9GAMM|nr:3-deoxy-D-manno-octulosonic acid kinase [Pseudoalteromonas aurantia]MBE0367088.1 3-deoxy-D-manno-octulosonic acid kinase [Pseudoalteromonas aurantia 208]
MHINDTKQGYILSPEYVEPSFPAKYFDASYWQQKNAIVGTKEGRATAWFFKHNDTVNVLKHYWRGGIIGKILSDQYIYTGLKNSRVYREFLLMCELQKRGLAVPQPIAARVTKSLLIYRGDLITSAIPGAISLCELLQTQPLTDQNLSDVALTIAEFHNAGVYHADLNINNILFDDKGKVYLIDFDRGELRKPALDWQNSNIERLQRSLHKEAGKWPTFYFTPDNWVSFHTHYMDARHP